MQEDKWGSNSSGSRHHMRITVISDLHGSVPELAGGDLLIIAGDLTLTDTEIQYFEFFKWASEQFYKKIIVIGGNHDNFLQKNGDTLKNSGIFSYLCDEGTEFEGFKIWGSPWTKTFPNMNPKCKAFTCDTEEELDAKFSLIPDDIDILITHSPAYGILDKNSRGLNCGSISLLKHIERVKPTVHVSAHIHEAYGQLLLKHQGPNTICINASHMDEVYDPINEPITIEI